MKKVAILLTALLIASVSYAQTNQTGTVTLNVNLHSVLSIDVNGSQGIVNLDYQTPQDYDLGVTSTNLNHLNVYATSAYQVAVRTSTPGLLSGVENLGGTIGVSATPASGVAVLSPRSLSNQNQTLFSGALGVANQKFNVDYEGAGNGQYLNKGQELGTKIFTTEVIYTISAL